MRILLLHTVLAIDWLSIHRENSSPEAKSCEKLRNDSERDFGRLKICNQEDPRLIQAVVTAAAQTKNACERAMHDRRWDCTSLQHAPKFKRDLRKGTSERAYVHSLSSAAVAINVARRCALGDISKCNCKNRSADQKFDDENQSISRPCEHDLEWAGRWTRQWTDVSKDYERKRYQPMIEQDNLVGRMVATRQMRRRVCKCHGASGSCTQSTCWYVAPDIDDVAEKLKKLYTDSVKVSKSRPERSLIVPSRARFSRNGLSLQMVYVDKSHDYCEKNAKEGSSGTRGRKCDPNGTGPGSCSELCCGRGYEVRRETIKNEQYNCRYVWCCKVECDTKIETITSFVCR